MRKRRGERRLQMPSTTRGKTQLQKFRSDVARLKSLGLVSKRVDARKQRSTKYMRGQVRKFADVLAGKAKAVHVPKRADAKQFAEKFRTKGKTIVVPVTAPGEKFSYSKKTGEIRGTKTLGGKKIKRRISSKPVGKETAPISGNVLYTIPIGNSRQSFDTWEDLVLFMEPYETNPRNPYKEWMKYVEITDWDGGDFNDEETD